MAGQRPVIQAIEDARKKRIKVGSKAYHLTAGQKKRITVKLNSKGKSLLKKFGKVPVKLAVTQKQLNGKSVTIESVMEKAKAEATEKVK